MKALELIENLKYHVHCYGNSDVAVATIDKLPDVDLVSVTTDVETDEPIFVLWPKGRPLREYSELYEPLEPSVGRKLS